MKTALPGELLHLDIKKLGRFRRPGHRVTGNHRHTSSPRTQCQPTMAVRVVSEAANDRS